MLVDFASGHQPVHERHGKVKHGNVRMMLKRQGDGPLAIFRFHNFSAGLCEELAESPSDGSIIVCNENSHGRFSGRGGSITKRRV